MKLVLVRHGESIWNKENIFKGWVDIGLSENGVEEAKRAGKVLKEKNYKFNICYTSILKRAIDTMDYIFDEMNINPKIYKDYRLNERHYGALQGLNKKEMADKVGEEQVKRWRRSLKERPPALNIEDQNHQINNPLFKDIPKHLLPTTESLEDTMKRVIECYQQEIMPKLELNKRIIIVAHGNSLRALVAYLEKLDEEEILNLNIPTGNPLVYEFDSQFKIIDKCYLY